MKRKKVLYIKEKRYQGQIAMVPYNLYGTYSTHEQALKTAKHKKKKTKTKYFIRRREEGILITETKYDLYFNKIWRPW